MHTDSEIQKGVIDELRWEPTVRDEEIAVACKDCVVTLSGQVHTYAQKYNAVRTAERVQGVRVVADDLAVKPAKEHAYTDTEIAHAVANALLWNSEVPRDRVKAKVDEGWVTLEGTVDWQFERSAAERAVRYLTGIRGVNNLVAIRSRVSPYDVSQRIKEALRRSADLDASHIEVKAHEGKVTLEGTVRSWAERRDAERAAWSAVGVTQVEDRLAVSA